MPLEYWAWIDIALACLFFVFGVVGESRTAPAQPSTLNKYNGSIVMFLVIVAIVILDIAKFGSAAK